MSVIKTLPAHKLGYDFIPKEYLPDGKDEYYIRYQQNIKPKDYWRKLTSDEIETLVKNSNTADSWDSIFVHDPFSPHLIKNSEFFGLIRIGILEDVFLEYHDLQVPAGITNSRIISCDIGDNCAVHNVSYIAHYILGNSVILFNIHEMHTTNYAKFGNGIVKEGEPEDVRIWIDLINETGGRAVMPFDGMIPADAWIWAKYRQDKALMNKLKDITETQFDVKRGYYGTVGDRCVIKNNRIIKDVNIGAACYIKGANKLKNLTIKSSEEEPTQVGEGVELVNGIVGFGCRIFYGCKAVRFIMGDNSSLKYGGRLIHSFLGDNSTVSCCEILNNLIFPSHEQHHNNSFLTATLVKGQSNIAAGVTIGSNHNSRANDGEIEAGRGFWPGLCTTLKHNCRFASYILLKQGDYPWELNVPLPFSLLANDKSRDCLMILPAYWWLYNMYALARNTWKFKTRDARVRKIQRMEIESLAPDSIEEIFTALGLLEKWTAEAWHASKGKKGEHEKETDLSRLGKRLLTEEKSKLSDIIIFAENIENSERKVVINKTCEAYDAYREMVVYYSAKNIVTFLRDNPDKTVRDLAGQAQGERKRNWLNVGGQLVHKEKLEAVLSRIKEGSLSSWKKIHSAYWELWKEYPLEKAIHAYQSLLELLEIDELDEKSYSKILDRFVLIQEFVCSQVFKTREKDYLNPFRQSTYTNAEEMAAVLGKPEENSFVQQVQKETEEYKSLVSSCRNRF